jgi:hypothetical protein
VCLAAFWWVDYLNTTLSLVSLLPARPPPPPPRAYAGRSPAFPPVEGKGQRVPSRPTLARSRRTAPTGVSGCSARLNVGGIRLYKDAHEQRKPSG